MPPKFENKLHQESLLGVYDNYACVSVCGGGEFIDMFGQDTESKNNWALLRYCSRVGHLSRISSPDLFPGRQKTHWRSKKEASLTGYVPDIEIGFSADIFDIHRP